MKRFLQGLAGVALVVLILLSVRLVTNGQQQVYGPGAYHGPFINGAGVQSLNQMLSPAYELPQVQAGAFTTGVSSYITWTAGRVYPDGIGAGGVPGIPVAPSQTTSGASLAASETSCDLPNLPNCNIAYVPYAAIVCTGGNADTTTVGEIFTQATSNATAYVLNAVVTGAGAVVYVTKTNAGTPDATHTWTGGSSSATCTTPTVPSGALGMPVLVTQTPAIAFLPSVTPVAYIETASTYAINTITYPYQYTVNPTRSSLLLTGFCSGTVTSAGTDYLFLLGGVAVACSSDTSATQGTPMASPGTLANLYVKDGTAPSGALTGVWTVLDNASATALTCTITGSATTCSDLTHRVLVKAGDLITISDATGTSSAEAAPQASVEKYNQ